MPLYTRAFYTNLWGPVDALPTAEIDKPTPEAPDLDVLVRRVPGESGRLMVICPDNAVEKHGGTLTWQDRSVRFLVPPVGEFESSDPRVSPPDEPIIYGLHYRLPEVRDTHNGYFVNEFGQRWWFKMADGYPDFYHFRQGKDVIPRLRQRRELGFNGCRTFFSGDINNNGFWDIRVFDAAWLRDAETYLRLLKSEALMCEATFANLNYINPTVNGQRAMFTPFWQMCAQFGTVLGEYSNESEDSDNGVHKEVCVRVPGILLSGGSSASDAPPPTPHLDWTGHHSKRGDFTNPDDVARCLDAMNLMHVQHGGWNGQGAGGHCVPVLNESQKAAQFEKKGSRTMNATYFHRLGAGTRVFGGMTFCSEAGGMYGILLEGPELNCAEACITGMNGVEWPG